MNTKITISKAIYSALFSAAMLCATSSAFAQVKIGTNPTVIGPDNNLEVESSTGMKTSIDKTTGKVTIADGSQGNGRVFTSNANGVGTWVAPTSQDSPVLFSLNKNGVPDQSVPLGTTPRVNFGAKVFDKGSNFNITTDIFTVPANGTGYYQINGAFHSIGQTHNLGAYMYVYVNGAVRRILCTGNANAGSGIVAGGAVVVWLSAGQLVDFRIGVTSADVIIDSAEVDVYMISR